MKTFLSLFVSILMSASLMAQTPTVISLNLQKGSVYRIKSTNKQVMEQSVAGQSFVVNIQTVRVISIKPLANNAESMELEMRFDSTLTKASSAMFKKETNSAQPGKDISDRLINKMSLFPLNFKIDKSGKFLGFTNLNDYKSNVMLFIDSLPDSKKDEARQTAEMLLKESALKSSVEPIFAHLPGKPVQLNDSWESSYVASSNDMSFLIFNTYVLKASDAVQASLSGTSEMESMPSSNPKIKLDQPIKGKSTLEGKVDKKTGLMQTMTEKSQIAGSMTVSNNGTDIKVDLKIDSQTDNNLIN